MSATSVNLDNVIEKWSIPFARAFAEFVKNVSTPASGPSADLFGKTPVWTEHADGFASRDITLESDPVLFAKIQRKIVQDSPFNGKFVEFDPAVPAKRYGNRLRQIFRDRGIKQAAIARKLNMAPSVISRVLKHPERSRLATIRRIADAAGISLGELV